MSEWHFSEESYNEDAYDRNMDDFLDSIHDNIMDMISMSNRISTRRLLKLKQSA
jgi:hypothetical protein